MALAGAQVLLQERVRVLSLPIGLWVVSGGQLWLGSEPLAESRPEVGSKLRPTVGDNVLWVPLFSPHELNKGANKCVHSEVNDRDELLLFA
ncbi:hypothetical protein PTT_15424 [Pyrenophora teres f. teres 0-1]|uniref:Uncharacterized protein n=1 Tax=Pyrenophora teres f. teres (strain 0-1) TaxID=861557 RepID=E3S071_PYRTT|nr:hypothetical protein PTT_15424 [Pyrenophora teres f. teres 0-1]